MDFSDIIIDIKGIKLGFGHYLPIVNIVARDVVRKGHSITCALLLSRGVIYKKRNHMKNTIEYDYRSGYHDRPNTLIRRRLPIIALLLFMSLQILPAQTSAVYHISKKIIIGGEGGWDYLTYQAATHRLFVSHSDRVVVVNTDSGTVAGEIPKTEGVHGIALSENLGKGYITDGRTGLVTVFELNTLKVIKDIPVGKKPDAIVYDDLTDRVFVCNGQSQDISVIDGKEDKVIGTISLGGAPEFAVTDMKGQVFVNIEDKSEIVAIDTKKMSLMVRWSLSPGEEPTGLAIDREHRRLFAVCHNKLMIVMDADDGKVLASLPIGSGVDGCAFDPGTGYAFASNGEGTLTVVREESPSTFSFVDNIPTQRGARTIALDPVTHTLYLPTAEFGPAPVSTPENPRPRPTIIPNSFLILQLKR